MGDEPQVMQACVDPTNQIEETDETNNCIRLLMAPGGLIGDDPDPYEEDNTWQTAGSLRDTSDANRAQEHNLHTSEICLQSHFKRIRSFFLEIWICINDERTGCA